MGMFTAWLSVFLAVVLYTITFAGPFVLVRRLRSRARAHRPARACLVKCVTGVFIVVFPRLASGRRR